MSIGESLLWSWLSGLAPCWRRKEAFSIRPPSTARKRGVWPRRVRLSTESGPETEEQIWWTSVLLLGFYVPVKLHRRPTFEHELQDGLVALSCGFMERSPTSAVRLWKRFSLSDTKILQQLLVTCRDGGTVKGNISTFFLISKWPQVNLTSTESVTCHEHFPRIHRYLSMP